MKGQKIDTCDKLNTRICISGFLVYLIGMIACIFAKVVLKDTYKITCTIIAITITIYSFVMTRIKCDDEELKNRALLNYSAIMKLIFLFSITFENRLYSEEALYMEDNPLLYVSFLIATVSTFIEIYMFMKNKKTEMLKKYIMIISLFMYFLGVMLTNSFWVLLILVPIFTAYAQFDNVKLITIGGCVANIIVLCGALTQIQYYDSNEFTTFVSIPTIIKRIFNGSLKDSSKYMMWIYVIIVIYLVLFTVALVSATKIIKKYNNSRIEIIQNEQSKIRKIMDKIIETGMNIKVSTFNTSSIVNELEKSISYSGEKLGDIYSDTEVNVRSIDKQKEMTHFISDLIDDVEGEVEKASISTKVSLQGLEKCKGSFEKLKDKSENIYKNTKEVIRVIEKFVVNTRKMKNITQGINEILEDTALLSFNAAVKSVKAGDKGKGFAVVAGEIHKLAHETSTLTDSINAIVEKL